MDLVPRTYSFAALIKTFVLPDQFFLASSSVRWVATCQEGCHIYLATPHMKQYCVFTFSSRTVAQLPLASVFYLVYSLWMLNLMLE